jgi:hypothetical protein
MWKAVTLVALFWFSVQSLQAQVPKIISRFQPPIDTDKEKLLTFSNAMAEIRREGNRCFLWAGDACLKDLGPNESDARDVLRWIRYFHLNQWATIGRPLPIMEYWLSDDRAPQKMGSSFRSSPFEADSLKIEDDQGQYWLRDAHQPLFVFGSREDAEQALAVIRKYGFTEIGYVGSGVPVMIVFLAGPEKTSGLAGPAPVTVNPAKPPKNDANQKALAALQLHPRQLNDSFTSRVSPLADKTVSFDWRQASVQFEHGHWKVIVGSLTLADFGPFEHDAQEALRLIRYYRLTERCTIGKPTAAFTFFLADGQPVRTLYFGYDTVFNPDHLSIAKIGPDWRIVDLDRPFLGGLLLYGGTREEDTRQVLQILQKYRVDGLIQVGSRRPTAMNVLVRTRSWSSEPRP